MSQEINNSDGFYQDLKEFATTPSEYQYEELVQKLIYKKLEDLVDSIRMDSVGNIYASRKGAKSGRVMFTAHQDKILSERNMGYIVPFIKGLGSNLLFQSKYFYDQVCESHPYIERDFRPLELIECKKYDKNPELIPDSIKRLKKKGYIPSGVSSTIQVESSREILGIRTLAQLKESKNYVSGKLDDAVGLALIVDLLKNTSKEKTLSITALFTIGEEFGGVGAQYAVDRNLIQRYAPDSIVVLDVSPLQAPNKGIVLYQDCAGSWLSYRKKKRIFQKKEPLVKEIERFAKKQDIPLTTHNAFLNDATILSETKIPTVALEVPVENMHHPVEICSKNDIAYMRKFLRAYIKNGHNVPKTSK